MLEEDYVLVPGSLDGEFFVPSDNLDWHFSVFEENENVGGSKASLSIHDSDTAFEIAFEILKQVRDGREIVELDLRRVSVSCDNLRCEEASETEAARAEAIVGARLEAT